MSRGSKSIDNTTGHRTKSETDARKKAEAAMLTGEKCSMSAAVKADKTAAAEFKRLTALLDKIGKNDALYEAQVNRYCELSSEIASAQAMYKRLEELARDDDEMLITAALRLDKLDATIMHKRKMMCDIEKENGWTALSAMRVIPKKPVEDDTSELIKILQGD